MGVVEDSLCLTHAAAGTDHNIQILLAVLLIYYTAPLLQTKISWWTKYRVYNLQP